MAVDSSGRLVLTGFVQRHGDVRRQADHLGGLHRHLRRTRAPVASEAILPDMRHTLLLALSVVALAGLAAACPRAVGQHGPPLRARAQPDRADRPGAAVALHGSLGAARRVPRPRGRQLRGVGLPAQGAARLPPVVRRQRVRRPDLRQQPRHDGGHQARGQHRSLRARDLHRRRHVARPARPGRRPRAPRRDDVRTDHRLREVQARPETDVAGRARRPVQLLGRRAEGLRGRRGQRQERRDHRLAARPHPARAAGAQPARRPVAVRHPDHSRDGRQRPRAHRHRRQRRETRRGEEDLRRAARVAGQGVRRGGCPLQAAPRGDDEHRVARQAVRPGLRVGQGGARQGVRLQPAPRLRTDCRARAVGHDRAPGLRLVLRRRHVHQRLGDLGVRRPRHRPAVARVPPQAPARRRQDDARAVAGRRLHPLVRGLRLRLLPRRHDAALHRRGARLRARLGRRRVREGLLGVDAQGLRLLRLGRRGRRRPDGQHQGRLGSRGNREAPQPGRADRRVPRHGVDRGGRGDARPREASRTRRLPTRRTRPRRRRGRRSTGGSSTTGTGGSTSR